MRAPTRTTLEEAADDWLAAARAGIARTRSGDPYKPSALRSYEEALRIKVLPELGKPRLSAVDRVAAQDLVYQLVAQGLAPSTVRNAVLPLRAIFRRAVARSEVVQNPTLGLSLPAVRCRRDRVARPEEARALIEAVPESDRAIWATALYAGLRRGELQALRWENVDFDAGVIRVERGWDQKAGPIEPKSQAARRRVALVRAPRSELAAHRLREGGGGELALGRGDRRFPAGAVVRRAQAAWRKRSLAPIGLHECRHTYAAFMIAAGVAAKASPPTWGTPRSPSPSTATATSCPARRPRRQACSRPTSRAPGKRRLTRAQLAEARSADESCGRLTSRSVRAGARGPSVRT